MEGRVNVRCMVGDEFREVDSGEFCVRRVYCLEEFVIKYSYVECFL